MVPRDSWVTGEAIRLDAGAPCDSGDHLGSARVNLRPWLPDLLHIWLVGSVGIGHLSVRESISSRERFQTSRERAGTIHPIHIPLWNRRWQCTWDLLLNCSQQHSVSAPGWVILPLGSCALSNFNYSSVSATGLFTVTASRCTSPTQGPDKFRSVCGHPLSLSPLSLSSPLPPPFSLPPFYASIEHHSVGVGSTILTDRKLYFKVFLQDNKEIKWYELQLDFQ